MIPLTAVETQLIQSITACGGQVSSLYRLAMDLGIDYGHARQRISVLELLGLLLIERSKGHPLIITIADPTQTLTEL
jgi:hypothetical protein